MEQSVFAVLRRLSEMFIANSVGFNAYSAVRGMPSLFAIVKFSGIFTSLYLNGLIELEISSLILRKSLQQIVRYFPHKLCHRTFPIHGSLCIGNVLWQTDSLQAVCHGGQLQSVIEGLLRGGVWRKTLISRFLSVYTRYLPYVMVWDAGASLPSSPSPSSSIIIIHDVCFMFCR